MVEQPEHNEPLVLSDVRIEYAARENVPWVVTAVRATVNRGETMRLHEARLSSLPAPGTASLLIETDELELDAKAYMARADHPVVLSRGGARVEAQGLTADLKQNRIELESGHGQLHR
jgi:LPS export ABC transporter protein LptC